MKARFHPEAEAELRQAEIEYGPRVLDVVADVVARALDTPHAGPLWPGLAAELAMRRRDVRDFRYMSLAYTVIDDALWIVAVVHERRRPHYWINRVKDLDR